MTHSLVNIIPFEPESTVSFHWCESSHQAMWSWYQFSFPMRFMPHEFNNAAKMFLCVEKAWKIAPTKLHLGVHKELAKRKQVCECFELCLDSPA
jgi:hypothetical protein